MILTIYGIGFDLEPQSNDSLNETFKEAVRPTSFHVVFRFYRDKMSTAVHYEPIGDDQNDREVDALGPRNSLPDEISEDTRLGFVATVI